eukprot:scaffold18321_cov138-Isochrysis_galbana.AAC.1
MRIPKGALKRLTDDDIPTHANAGGARVLCAILCGGAGAGLRAARGLRTVDGRDGTYHLRVGHASSSG